MTAITTAPITGGNVEEPEQSDSTHIRIKIAILLLSFSVISFSVATVWSIDTFIKIGEANSNPENTYSLLLKNDLRAVIVFSSVFFMLSGMAAASVFMDSSRKVLISILLVTILFSITSTVINGTFYDAMKNNQSNFTQWANKNYGVTLDESPILKKFGMQDGLILTYNDKSEAATLHKDDNKWLLYDVNDEAQLPTQGIK